MKTPHKRLQERTVQLGPIKLQNRKRYCSYFIPQSFGVVGYTIVIGIYSFPGSILHHERPQHPRTSVQTLHAPWVTTRHHWPALGLRNTHPCCPRGDKVGRNQLRPGKWAGGLEARDPECGLKWVMGSTLGPSGAGSRQGRTRVRSSEAQNPRVSTLYLPFLFFFFFKLLLIRLCQVLYIEFYLFMFVFILAVLGLCCCKGFY